MKSHVLAVTLVLALCSATIGCTASWIKVAIADLPILTQVALNIAQLANGGVSAQSTQEIQKVSKLASDGIALIKNAYDQYEAGAPGSSTQKIIDAGNVLEGNLGQALSTMQIDDLALRTRITSAVNLIVATMDTVIVLVPQPTHAGLARQTRVTGPPLTPKQLKDAWDKGVCHGFDGCPALALPKKPGFLHGLGNAIGEAKWGG